MERHTKEFWNSASCVIVVYSGRSDKLMKFPASGSNSNNSCDEETGAKNFFIHIENNRHLKLQHISPLIHRF